MCSTLNSRLSLQARHLERRIQSNPRGPGLPRWGLEAGPKAWSRTSDVPEMLPMGVPPFLLPPNGLLQQATRRFRRGVRQRAPPSNTSSVAPQSRCSPTRAVE